MPKTFTDYVLKRIISEADDLTPQPAIVDLKQAKEKIKKTQIVFKQARDQLSQMIDDKFKQLNDQMQKSFGSQHKIDQVSRTQIVTVLGKIADRINRMGSEENNQPAIPTMPQVPVEAVNYINNTLIKAELLVEDNQGDINRIRTVSEYLNSMKTEIMSKVNDILNSLQQDSIMKMMSNIQKGVNTVQDYLGGNTPLNADEKNNAIENLLKLGNTINMQLAAKRTFSNTDNQPRRSNNSVQILLPGGYEATFDPNNRQTIKDALARVKNPRSAQIKVGDKIQSVDLTNSEEMSELISNAEELMGQNIDSLGTTADNNASNISAARLADVDAAGKQKRLFKGRSTTKGQIALANPNRDAVGDSI